ncbi:MAG: ATP-binding protein [Pseudomonadota bacterium]|nr:ATP-binding protein [Pseudomonadota bacterium]
MSDVPVLPTAHERLLLLLPTNTDARLTSGILQKNDIATTVCHSPGDLARQLEQGAAAVLVSEESLAHGAQAILMRAVERQPRWSDIPVLVLTRSGANSQQVGDAIEQLGNVTVLERPLRLATMVSTVRSALRARQRQYQIRTHLDELETARDDQARAARRKDEFLAMLAHELRNPLAPIRNALHLLGTNGEMSGNNEGVRAMMARQVDHMVRLVDDLVDVSRLSRGTIELRRERVEMGSMLRNAVELSRPLLDAGQHRLETVMPDDPLWVDADPVRIAQVLGNLLNNAAKYATPEGHITVSVARRGDEAVVCVRDRGIGIEPEMLPHVFELFTQGRRDAHRAQDGLGIGLTLVRSLVEMHGGSVTASSEGFGHGSEFVVRLPLAEGEDSEGIRISPARARTAPAAESQFAGLRVLVVDDNVDAAMSLGMVMDLLGIEHEVLFTGQEALDLAGRFLPHAVLLDIGMPGMDGYEVARRLRSDPRHAHTTLVALTGWSQMQDQQRARDAGFDHHFSKPADIGALQRLLVTLVPAAAGQRHGGPAKL